MGLLEEIRTLTLLKRDINGVMRISRRQTKVGQGNMIYLESS